MDKQALKERALEWSQLAHEQHRISLGFSGAFFLTKLGTPENAFFDKARKLALDLPYEEFCKWINVELGE